MSNRTHVRVRMARYEFAPVSLASLAGTASAWSIGAARPLLPPLSLGTLFTLLDEKDGITVASAQMTDQQKKMRVSQLPKEAQPETAAEIIQRMMRRK